MKLSGLARLRFGDDPTMGRDRRSFCGICRRRWPTSYGVAAADEVIE
jgi:hypothetical protein